MSVRGYIACIYLIIIYFDQTPSQHSIIEHCY